MNPRRLPARRLAAATLAIALGLATCSSPTRVSSEASDAAFTLALSGPGGPLRSSDALDIRAALDYGAPPSRSP